MRRTRALVVAITAATFLVVSSPSIANASDDHGKIAKVGTTSQTNSRSPVVTLTPGASTGVTPMVTGSGGRITGYHAVTITPPAGKAGTFNQGFSSYYTHGSGVQAYFNVSSGSSYTHWLGSTPYAANSIGLTDRIWVGGVSISISVGASPSAGVSIANNTVTMSSSVGNNWRNEHSYSNVKFTSLILLYGPYQNSSDSATFSYKTFYDNIS